MSIHVISFSLFYQVISGRWEFLELRDLKERRDHKDIRYQALYTIDGDEQPATEMPCWCIMVTVQGVSPSSLYTLSGAHQMEPPSPLISCVNPFPSRFINRTASFPRKVSYFRESRVSPHRAKIKLDEVELRSSSFDRFPFFLYVHFYNFTAAGIWVS